MVGIILNPSKERASKPVTAISVALCTCNGGAFLQSQLQSIAAQTRRPAELVICDDQSTDDTASVVAAFAHDSPFPVSFNTNPVRLGVTGNFARAISLCQYPLIATCDQDDQWLPDKLAKLSQCFSEDPACLLAFSDMSLMTADGNDTGRTQWQQLGFDAKDVEAFNQGRAFEMLLRFNVITGMAMMFRSSLLPVATPFSELFIHDQWLGLLAAATGKVTAVNEPLVKYRQHENQKIGSANRNPVSQWRYARKHVGSDYISKQLAMTQALHDRLARNESQLRKAVYLSLVSQKIAHLIQRVALRSSMLSRWPGAMRQMVQGNYSRYGHGWRSLAQDLFL